MIRKYWAISMAALALVPVLSSCSHDKDMYNPDIVTDEFKQNFEATIGQVNPNQDWQLFTSRGVSVKVGGESTTEYTLYVCDKNPVLDKTASLLAVASAKGGTTANLSINVAKVIETLYIVRGDGTQQQVVTANLNGNQYEGSFVYSPTASARTRAALASGNPFNVINTDGYYKTEADAAGAAELVGGALSGYAAVNNYKVSSGACTPWPYYDVEYNIFVTGNASFDLTQVQNKKVNIYVVKGTLTITGDDTFNNANGFISVSEGAKLVWDRGTTVIKEYTRIINPDNVFTIYNRGTLEVKGVKLALADNAVIYNEGKLDAPNGIEVIGGTGKAAFLYNIGENAELNLGSLMVSSRGNFLNDGGKVTVNGLTEAGDGATTWWVNNGRFDSENFNILENNQNFYNYCQLFIDKALNITGGGSDGTNVVFHLMDNSYVEAATATLNNVTVEMGTGAGFNIKGNSLWKAKGSAFQGFEAGSGQAYVRLGGTTSVESHVRNLQGTGNVAIAINDLNDLGNDNEGDRPLIEFINGATMVNFASMSVTPSTTGCGAAWTIGGGIEPELEYNTIAFEDLGSTDDFDFNDIVLETARDAKTGKTVVRLVGAGGILSVEVKYGDEVLFTKTDGVMNTARGEYGKAEINMQSNADLRKFSIVVTKDGRTSSVIQSAAVKGQAPQALIIPGKWAWPTERTSITSAYPNFVNWVENVTNTDWYNAPVDGKVVR